MQVAVVRFINPPKRGVFFVRARSAEVAGYLLRRSVEWTA
jgi:hypothetical protein